MPIQIITIERLCMAPKKKITKEEVQNIEADIRLPEPKKEKQMRFISSGSTLLNLALSDRVDGGYLVGSFVNVIGDSSSGKTSAALTMMAEALRDERFLDYQFVYDLPEATMNFDLQTIFGDTFGRVRFLPEDRTVARTIQDWHHDLYKITEKPTIHVTDSFDALTSIGDVKNVEEGSAVAKTGWKTEKAMVSSAAFPQIIGRIEEHDSLLFIISQTRDNIGVTFGPAKKQSGGNAMVFYRTHAIWLSEGQKIHVVVREKKREIGHWTHAKVSKNKVTGKIRQISFPVYYDYGIDDIGSCIEWLVTESFWTADKKGALDLGDDAERLNLEADKRIKRDSLIKHIEGENLEKELKSITGECWQEIEEEIHRKTSRKPRYSS